MSACAPSRAERLAALFVAACGNGVAHHRTDRERAAAARRHKRPSPTAAPTADACAPENLALKTAGKLTDRRRQPRVPAVLRGVRTAQPRRGTRTSATRPTARASRAPSASRSPTRWASRRTQVTWVVDRRSTTPIQPGPKDFDIYLDPGLVQPGAGAGRRPQRRLLRPDPVRWSCSADSKFAKAKSIADLKDMRARRPGRHHQPQDHHGRRSRRPWSRGLRHQRRRRRGAQERQADRRPRRRPADGLLRHLRPARRTAPSSASSRTPRRGEHFSARRSTRTAR